MKFDDIKPVLDDARARQQALTALILYTDRQAMMLFRVYITVTLAAIAATATVFLSPEWAYLGHWRWGLIGVVVSFGAGCFLCLKSMAPADIGLAGRGADFWLWALHDHVSGEKLLRTYLEQLNTRLESDRTINEELGGALNRAKRAAMLAPVASLLAVAVAYAADNTHFRLEGSTSFFFPPQFSGGGGSLSGLSFWRSSSD